MGGLAVAVSQISVILVDDPTICQLEIASSGKSLYLKDGPIVEAMFPISGKSILGDTDFVTRAKGNVWIS